MDRTEATNKVNDIVQEVQRIVSPAYLVGGSVRDLLIGQTPKDYDFCTPMLPDDIEAAIRAAGRKPYLIGKKFGTVGFKVETDKHHYVEVTTYRQETYQENNRKPAVTFISSLDGDLSRRDFTINSIAYDGRGYYDPNGGRIDIIARKIKAVGVAKQRLKEDPLRMLRAVRFNAQLGFEIDPMLVGAIKSKADTLYTISRERWVMELDKILMSPRPAEGIMMLYRTGILRFVLPELYTLFFLNYELFEETLQAMTEAADNDVPLDKRWPILYRHVGYTPQAWRDKSENRLSSQYQKISHDLYRGLAARLRFSNDREKSW